MVARVLDGSVVKATSDHQAIAITEESRDVQQEKATPIKSLIAEGSHHRQYRFTDGLRVDGTVTGNIEAARATQPSGHLRNCMCPAMSADHIIINGFVGPGACATHARTAAQGARRRRCSLQHFEMHQGP